MSQEQGADRRKFIRICVDLPVKYNFVALDPRKRVDSEIHEGFTHDLSQGGLLLIGKLPVLDWISPLLMSRMVVGVSLEVPGQKRQVKALCRTAWVEAVEEKSQRRFWVALQRNDRGGPGMYSALCNTEPDLRTVQG
jgi:hypothetical protein